MPNMDGLALCRRIRAAHFPEYTYIILLTGHSDKGQVKRGFEAGADDYVTKPFDSAELMARLRVGLRILSMQTRMHDQQRQLAALANLDGLTGVLNRRALEGRLQEALAQAGRRGHSMSVALLDLDRFKRINDTFGHQAGDQVLKTIATRIREVTRDYDAVGRYGGEEFMVILSDAGYDAALTAAERIRRRVGSTPVDFEGRPIPVTASIGVGTVRRPHEMCRYELVALADSHLYDAKRSGRDCVVGGELPVDALVMDGRPKRLARSSVPERLLPEPTDTLT